MALRAPEVGREIGAPDIVHYINVWYILKINLPDDAAVIFPAFRRTKGQAHIPQGYGQIVVLAAKQGRYVEVVAAIRPHPAQKRAVEKDFRFIRDAFKTEQHPSGRLRRRKSQAANRFSDAKRRERHPAFLRRTSVDAIVPPGA